MNQNKIFWRLLGKESLYMLLLSIIGCVAALIQVLFYKYIDSYSSFIFSGSNYQYNYFMYMLGIILYFGSVILLYKKYFKKDFDRIVDINILYRIISLIVLVLWGVIIFAAELIGLFMCVLGLSNNLKPDVLFLITLVGWPIITLIYIVVMTIKVFCEKSQDIPENLIDKKTEKNNK